MTFPTWVIWAAPVTVIAAGWSAHAGYQWLRNYLSKSRPQLLDLGGIALGVILQDLHMAMQHLSGTSGQDDPELLATITRMTNSALCALRQSTQWGRTLDPLVAQQVGSALVEALRLTPVGSEHWQSLKRSLDVFDSHLNKWRVR